MKTVEEIRQRFLTRLALALRRPHMFGEESALNYFLTDLLDIDDRSKDFDAKKAEWWSQDLWSNRGIMGAFWYRFGGFERRWAAEVGSVYAEAAHGFGYLELDRTLSQAEWKAIRSDLRRRCLDQNWSSEEIEKEFGPASFWSGDGYHRVLCYATERGKEGWVFFDCEGELTLDQPAPTDQVRRINLSLRDVRLPAKTLSHSLVLTPYGRASAAQPRTTQ